MGRPLLSLRNSWRGLALASARRSAGEDEFAFFVKDDEAVTVFAGVREASQEGVAPAFFADAAGGGESFPLSPSGFPF